MSDPESISLPDYLRSAFKTPDVHGSLEDEFHTTWWRERCSKCGGGAQSLVEVLSQFQVPIASGASQSEDYIQLIRKASAPVTWQSAVDLFADPDSVHWSVVDHPAGGLPVVTLEDRSDFELAFRALGARCEPVAIGENVHALYVGGLPNPVRLRELESAFIDAGNDPQAWPSEMQRRVASDGTSFHDRLILLHPAPYGGLPASDVDDRMDDHEWVKASMRLRREHEFTHHATHRLLGSYRLHVHDEVLADLMGFTRALGRFDGELFLRALGVRGERIETGARLLTYTVGLASEALPPLVRLLRDTAKNIESISPMFVGATDSQRLHRLLALSQINLGTLAKCDPEELIDVISVSAAGGG